VAARTDPELKESLVAVEHDVSKAIAEAGPALMPEIAKQSDFQTDVQAAIAAIRGLALLKFVEDPAETERRWKRTKKRLMSLFVQLDLTKP
jgi:hypothetical protein